MELLDDDVIETLRDCQKLFKETLPKFNWANSFLDANAIRLLNEVPIKVDKLLQDIDNGN